MIMFPMKEAASRIQSRGAIGHLLFQKRSRSGGKKM
jgi:hypothetical protein